MALRRRTASTPIKAGPTQRRASAIRGRMIRSAEQQFGEPLRATRTQVRQRIRHYTSDNQTNPTLVQIWRTEIWPVLRQDPIARINLDYEISRHQRGPFFAQKARRTGDKVLDQQGESMDRQGKLMDQMDLHNMSRVELVNHIERILERNPRVARKIAGLVSIRPNLKKAAENILDSYAQYQADRNTDWKKLDEDISRMRTKKKEYEKAQKKAARDPRFQRILQLLGEQEPKRVELARVLASIQEFKSKLESHKYYGKGGPITQPDLDRYINELKTQLDSIGAHTNALYKPVTSWNSRAEFKPVGTRESGEYEYKPPKSGSLVDQLLGNALRQYYVPNAEIREILQELKKEYPAKHTPKRR